MSTALLTALAGMTALRDREALELSLCAVVVRHLGATDVSLHRLAGDGDQPEWRQRTRWNAAQQQAEAVPAPSLPQQRAIRMDALPLLAACVRQGLPQDVTEADGTVRLAWPVQVDGVIIGAIECHLPSAPSAAARARLAHVLSVYANMESVLNYAERDTLTGLQNRKTFDLALLRLTAPVSPRPMSPAERRQLQPPLGAWLAVIDIDHFKKVNDRYGHLIGDEVLLHLAQIMRTTFRDQDQLFRFGGEEFVVLLRCASEDDAARAMERLRSNVEHHRFPRTDTVTVSIGLTEVKPGEPPSAAFERADRAVYFAKEQGRNQMCSHARLIQDGLILDDDRTGDVELF